ncbi:MAG: M23 family metallopeptidase [Pseudomonadota bacterium]
MATHQKAPQFGKRREPLQIVIAKGSDVRSFSLKPWIATTFTLFAIVFAVTYLGATSYLVFRDDLLAFVDDRTDRMKDDYEDRIAYLRSQIDNMTSRKLVDQETLETKLEIMLRRQAELSDRHQIVASVFELARDTGIPLPATLQQPVAKPARGSIITDTFLLRTGDRGAIGSGSPSDAAALGPRARLEIDDVVFQTTADRVNQMTKETALALDTVRVVASSRTQAISQVLGSVGLKVKRTNPAGLGGPFVPASDTAQSTFGSRAEETKLVLTQYRDLRETLSDFPIGAPIEGAAISSRYGRRLDPFLKRPAMHSGIDYRARRGHPVIAAANGTVVIAGRHGGYGKLVEIAHGDGFTTRYAHLSKLHVKKGQTVTKGMLIGNVGSTGRSTGPHLHYEVRVGERPGNPLPYIEAGRKISKLLAD